MKPLEYARQELEAAAAEIDGGDPNGALWRLHDCLAGILEHLNPGPTGSQRAGAHAQDQEAASGGGEEPQTKKAARTARVERQEIRALAEGT